MSPSAGETAARTPRITVAFLLYNAASDVGALLQGLVRQAHPSFPSQSDWLEAVFVDDASGDGTAEVVARAWPGSAPRPITGWWRTRATSGWRRRSTRPSARRRPPSSSRATSTAASGATPTWPRCSTLIEAHPRAAAITGQPGLPPGARLPFAEKLNVVANLMDIFPADTANELVPVGFAEGRCDVFRVEALRQVGLYDTQLRVSGEDQVLAAKLRAKGYEIYQAPGLTYHLSVSAEQDSVGKILRHQRLFGRTTPYIVLRVPGSRDGLVGPRAGANRSRRALLRATQLAASAVLALAALSLLAGWPGWAWGSALVLLAVARGALFARQARAVRFSAGEWLAFVLLQPLLDLAYTTGILEGLLLLAWRGRSAPID